MDKMVVFYQGLGLHVNSNTTEKVRIVKLIDGKTQLELLQYESQPANRFEFLITFS